MPQVSRTGTSRALLEQSNKPFVGSAPGYDLSQIGKGIFHALQNVDVYSDRIETRKPLLSLVPPVNYPPPKYFNGCVVDCLKIGDYEYILSLNKNGNLYMRQIGYTPPSGDGWTIHTISRDADNGGQFMQYNDEVILFHPDGNLAIYYDVRDYDIHFRTLGIERQWHGTSSLHAISDGANYGLFRHGIECTSRNGDGVAIRSSSIDRNTFDTVSYGGVMTFSASKDSEIGYDSIRVWRSKQLNVSTDSSNNVAVGSPDEMYLIAEFTLLEIPSVIGYANAVENGAVKLWLDSVGVYKFEDRTLDNEIDDTTVQGIDAINLSILPAANGGAMVGARIWTANDDGLRYSNIRGTIWGELHDPLNRKPMDAEIVAVVEHFGDVLALGKSRSWRVASGDPTNNPISVGAWGCAGVGMVRSIPDVGAFAVNQDGFLRVIGSGMQWTGTIGGVPFSDMLGTIGTTANSINAVMYCGDLFIGLPYNVLKLNLSSGCGLSLYKHEYHYLTYAFLHNGGKSLGFADSKNMASFSLASKTGVYDWLRDECQDGTHSTALISVLLSGAISSASGFVELFAVDVVAEVGMGSTSPSDFHCYADGHDYGSGGSVVPTINGVVNKYTLIAPKATSYLARPIGKEIRFDITSTGYMSVKDIVYRYKAQDKVRPGFNPHAIFGG